MVAVVTAMVDMILRVLSVWLPEAGGTVWCLADVHI